jgi:uncharacterized protein (DUF1015 family)
MIKIKPFKGFTPKANYGGKVSTRQINSYSEEELQLIIDSNPDSFLNIILRERNEDISSSEKFKKISDLFDESIENGRFVQSKNNSIYVYRQSNEEVSYTGIIAGASNEDYQQDKIKKHEHTLAKREKLFTKYLRLTGFNAEPTLLIHSKNIGLEQIQKSTIEKSPLHYFTSDDGLTHELWEISDDETIEGVLNSFNEMDCLYIADGHHRSASSSRLALETPEKESTQSVMALFMSEENITIHDFNRVVKNTEQKSEEEILESLNKDFNFIDSSESILEPRNKHEFCIYLKNKWNRIKLRKEFNSDSTVVEQLDSQIITDYILSPIFGIEDLKNDNRVDFIQGNKGLSLLQSKVDNGKFDVAIAMYPVDVAEMKQIADEGLAMPPKSTFIEPKLRSGLTVYKF